MTSTPIRLLFTCHSISGYMAATWRALARRPEVTLKVLAGTSNPNFKPDVIQGLDVELLTEAQMHEPDRVLAVARAFRPDVASLNGWFMRGVRALALTPELAGTRFILSSDRPWTGSWRQRMGRFVNRRLFSKIDLIFVPGERGYQFARHLGFSDDRIMRGMYGVDFERLSDLHQRRADRPQGWPRRWLFMGRYHPDKGLDVLVQAYRIYRDRVPDPWELTTLGAGEQKSMLAGVPGLTDRGFVQPADQPDVLLEHGAFVLSSRFDPWPLVVVEAAAAGLPIVCTEACGSGVELVRPCSNGFTCRTEDPGSLARAMEWLHDRSADLETMGRASVAMASVYSATACADRWVHACRQVMGVR